MCCCCCWLVTKTCPTLCDPMDSSMPGFPVLHCLPEFVQSHVHWVNDAIQWSPPLCYIVFSFLIVILCGACYFFNTQQYDSKLDGHIPQRRIFLPGIGKPFAYVESHIQCFTVIFNWEKNIGFIIQPTENKTQLNLYSEDPQKLMDSSVHHPPE